MSEYQEKIFCFLSGCIVTFIAMFFIVIMFVVPKRELVKGTYKFNNPPPPPVVDTFYPDDLVWHKYLKRAGIVTRTHYGDEKVSVIPVMVKGDQIISIRQSDEIVEYWTTALIFKTNKENYILLEKMKGRKDAKQN